MITSLYLAKNMNNKELNECWDKKDLDSGLINEISDLISIRTDGSTLTGEGRLEMNLLELEEELKIYQERLELLESEMAEIKDELTRLNGQKVPIIPAVMQSENFSENR